MWFMNRCGANPSIRWSCLKQDLEDEDVLDYSWILEEEIVVNILTQ